MQYDKLVVYGLMSVDHLKTMKNETVISSYDLRVLLHYFLKVPDIYEALVRSMEPASTVQFYQIPRLFAALDSDKLYTCLPKKHVGTQQRTTNNRLTQQNINIAKAAIILHCKGLRTMQQIARVVLVCSLFEAETQLVGIPTRIDIVYKLLKQVDLTINPRALEEFLSRSKPYLKLKQQEQARQLALFDKLKEQLKTKDHSFCFDSKHPLAQQLRDSKSDVLLLIEEFLFLSANAIQRSTLLSKLPSFIPQFSRDACLNNVPGSMEQDTYIHQQFEFHNKGVVVTFEGMCHQEEENRIVNLHRANVNNSVGMNSPIRDPRLHSQEAFHALGKTALIEELLFKERLRKLKKRQAPSKFTVPTAQIEQIKRDLFRAKSVGTIPSAISLGQTQLKAKRKSYKLGGKDYRIQKVLDELQQLQ